MNNKLKLYVWGDYKTDWTPGLAIALAYSRKQAEKLVLLQNRTKKEYKDSPYLLEYETQQLTAAKLTVYNLDKAVPFATCVSGGD